MPVHRFAGQNPELEAALQRSRQEAGVTLPAFEPDGSSGWRSTANTDRVLGELQRVGGGKPVNLRAANSVDAIEGRPVWGTGNGVVYSDPGRAPQGLVDPWLGEVQTVAHEGAHAVAPSEPMKEFRARGGAFDPYAAPRDNGTRVVYVNNMSKPSLVEEGRAQGVATGIMDRLGLPRTKDYGGDPLQYPMTYATTALDEYFNNEKGPYTQAERDSANRVFRNTGAVVQRAYAGGYQLGRGN